MPYFYFPEIAATSEFVFEKLTRSNSAQLHRLFQNDLSPFVDARFKTAAAAHAYALELEQYGDSSPKHGGQDWLVRHQTIGYIGVVHLYDLSLETWNQNHQRAWVGFATNRHCRQKGFTKKYLLYFIQYIRNAFPQICFLHAMTGIENHASQHLLLACGFAQDHRESMEDKYCFFVTGLSV